MNYQLAVIGGGPAGYTAAEIAGKAGMSVVLFEKNALGGVCLNEGCIPTKTLLYSAKIYEHAIEGSKYGVNAENVSVDLPKIIARKAKIIRKLGLGIKARLTAANVKIVLGEAFIVDKNNIKCGEESYVCDKMIICTGSETIIPDIKGLDEVCWWTHRDALNNKEIPSSLTIIGGGVIGIEFASFFNSLGTKVTVIEMLDEILGAMDNEISSFVRTEYIKRGIKFILSAKVLEVYNVDNHIDIIYQDTQGVNTIESEKLLLSVGRRPVMKGIGLENLDMELTERKCIKVRDDMQSSVNGVYVCGDLNGTSLLAHTAIREAEVAVNNILGIEDRMEYTSVPGVVYTNPEVSGVGSTEEQLIMQGMEYNSIKLPMTYAGRFVVENEGFNGLCKILTKKDNTMLGVHIVGTPSSEFIVVAGNAIRNNEKLDDLKRYIFPHPTVSEILHEL